MHDERTEETAPRPRGDPGESVLDAVERATGADARVTLSGADDDEAPVSVPGSDAADFSPRGRGDYRVLGEIARGGMGRILRAIDGDLGREVAIKVLDPRLAGRADVLRRFVEEAQVGGQLQHPGIVPVYELGLMADERPYFTMKLVKGRTLADLLASRRSPSEDLPGLLRAFEAVCQTVAYAHSKGVIHRDLKPANVMVGAFGEVQVVDWGLAKVLRRGGVDDELRAQREGRTLIETVRSGPPGSGSGSDSLVGSVLGTPAYMPPEQARGQIDDLDERADVFALGAILCEVLTGKPPYVEREGGDTLVVQASRARLDDADARLAASGGEPELVELARACLAPAPGARPRNAGAVASAVRDHLAATAERAREAELEAAEARVRARAERKARVLTLGLAAAGTALVVALAVGWTWRQRAEARRTAVIARGLDGVERKVRELQGLGREDEALASALNALGLVEGLRAESELRARAEELVATSETTAREAAERRAQAERDAALLRTLDELRLESALETGRGRDAELERRFLAAFSDWGLEIDRDPLASLGRLTASGFVDELAWALDDWALIRGRTHGWRSLEADTVISLAADLDPDPERRLMRDALVAQDGPSLLELARSEGVADWPAATVWVLGRALLELGRSREAIVLLEPATARYPGELRLRIAAAACARDVGRWDVALRHVSAAVALRPDLPVLSFYEGLCLARNSRFPAAALALERFLAAWPEHAEALGILGESLAYLGDFEGAAAAFERLEALGDRSYAWAERRLADLSTGRIDLDTFLAQLDAMAETSQFARIGQAWMLVEMARGPADLERAMALVEDPAIRRDGAYWHVRAMVMLALDRPQEALAACHEPTKLGPHFYPPDKWVHLVSLRARALARLGRGDEALEWLTEGWRTFETLRADSPEAWTDSIALRQLRQADEELGR